MLLARQFREVEAEPWSALPEALRRTGVRSPWADANLRQPVGSFLEAPDFDSHGNLHVVDIPFGRVLRIDAGKRWEVIAEYPGWPNGLKCQEDGSLLIADYKLGLLRLKPGAAPEELLAHRNTERFKGLNDLTRWRDGALYFTDQGQSGLHDASGRVLRWSDSGAATLVLQDIPSPNGLVMNPAGNQLWLAVTRDNAIWRVPLQDDGSVTKVGRWIQLSGGIGPDGITCDRHGNLWVAHFGLGCVWRFNARGEATLRVHTPGDWPTNVVEDARSDRIFIVESQRAEILTIDTDA